MSGSALSGTSVDEGGIRLSVPHAGHHRGPKARHGGAFYNPAMVTARDLSVALAVHEGDTKAGYSLLDGFAATGARSVRMATALPEARVTAVDRDQEALKYARINIEAAGTQNVELRHQTFEEVAAADRFDWVDIDPYGSPARFLDAGTRAVRDGGILAVTATDTATLHGVYPGTCRRRYDARPLRCPFSKELALRILAGAIVRTAARHDIAAWPVLSHATDHYLRLHMRIRTGAQRADQALHRLGYAWHHDNDRAISVEPPPDWPWAGPLWADALAEPAAVTAASSWVQGRDWSAATHRLARRLDEEADLPPLYFTLQELGKGRKGSLRRIDDAINALQGQGHAAGRTHFVDQAIKTDAPWRDVLDASVA